MTSTPPPTFPKSDNFQKKSLILEPEVPWFVKQIGDLTLYIFKGEGGSFSGSVDLRSPLPLCGLPPSIDEEDLDKAIQMISLGTFRPTDRGFAFQPSLLGGGSNSSKGGELKGSTSKEGGWFGFGRGEIVFKTREAPQNIRSYKAPPIKRKRGNLRTIAPLRPAPQMSKLPHHGPLLSRRGSLEEKIEESFRKRSIVYLSGAEGSGKLTQALSFFSSKEDLTLTWLIDGRRIGSSLLELAVALELSTLDGDKNLALEVLQKWFETHEGWALVIEEGLRVDELSFFSPKGQGKILVTSSTRLTIDDISIDPLDQKGSEDLLSIRSVKTDRNLSSVTMGESKRSSRTSFQQELSLTPEEKGLDPNDLLLQEKLGNSPLTLTLAKAFIEGAHVSPQKYLEDLEKELTTFSTPSEQPEGEDRSFSTVCGLTMRFLQEHDPNFFKLLFLASYCSTEEIPHYLLDTGEIEETFGLLSKITQESFSIDPKIQTFIQSTFLPEGREKWLETLLDKLQEEWNFREEDPSTLTKSEQISPHLVSLCKKCTNVKTLNPKVADLLGSHRSFKSYKYSQNPPKETLEEVFSPLDGLMDELSKSIQNIEGVLQEVSNERDSKEELAEALQGNLLALTLARSYMEVTKPSYSDYLTLLKSEKSFLRERPSERTFNQPFVIPFRILLNDLQQRYPSPFKTFFLSSFLSPHHIPKILFGDQNLEGDLNILLNLKLIRFLEENTFSVHPALQDLAGQNTSPPRKVEWLEELLQTFEKGWDFKEEKEGSGSASFSLAPHLLSLLKKLEEEKQLLPQVAVWFEKLGNYYTLFEEDLQVGAHCFEGSLRVFSAMEIPSQKDTIRLLGLLAKTYRADKKWTEALHLNEKALVAIRALYPKDPLEVVRGLHERALSKMGNGQFKDSINDLKEALALLENKTEAEPVAASLYQCLGECAFNLSRYKEAIDAYAKAIPSPEKELSSEKKAEAARSLFRQGEACRALDEKETALETWNRSLLLRCENLLTSKRADKRELSENFSALARLYVDLKDPSNAIIHMTKAIYYEGLSGSSDPFQLAFLQVELGSLYCQIGDVESGFSCFLEALHLTDSSGEKPKRAIAPLYFKIASIYQDQKSFDLAILYFEEYISALSSAESKESFEIALANYQIGDCFQSDRKFPESITYYLKSFRSAENICSRGDPTLFEIRISLGRIYRLNGQIEEAQNYLEKNISNIEYLDERNRQTIKADTLSEYGLLKYEEGLFKEAEAHFVEALRLKGQAYGEKSQPYISDLEKFGRNFIAQNRLREGETYLTKGLELAKTLPKEDRELVASLLNSLGEAYLKGNKLGMASIKLEEAQEKISTTGDEETLLGAKILINRGALERKKKNTQLSDTYYLSASTIIRNLYGEGHSIAQNLLEQIPPPEK